MESFSDQPFLYIIVAVVGAGILGVAGYFVMRALKGSLALQLNRESVRSGETLTGTLVVNARKGLDADRLYVALVGERQVKSRNTRGQTSTKWVTFYRDEVDLLTNEFVRAGPGQSHAFALKAPTMEQAEGFAKTGLDELEAAIAGVGNERATKFARELAGLARSSNILGHGKRRWKVIARLETRGVDLATSERVNVSLDGAG